MSKPLKILIIGPAWPLRGGLATYNERLCRQFNQMGHQAEILSFSLQYPKILFPGKTQFSSDPKPNDLIIHEKINSINPLNWIFTGIDFKKKNFDIVIFRYWLSFMAPAFGTVARILGSSKTKIVAITDNIVPHEKRFFDGLLTRYFLNACNGFLCMSRDVFAQVEKLQPQKPRTYVPHPMYDMFGPAIDKQKAKTAIGLEHEYNYLLFFGFIRKYKGLGLLLESFAKTDYINHKLKLIVAGEFYEDDEPYIQQITNLNLSEYVVLRTDFIPNSEVANYFCACDLVVQTYLHATQSGVTQIAYFYNKPMLVTNVGGLAELVPHNKVGYVCNKNSDEIASFINDFYVYAKADSFSKEIEKEKTKFTWQYVAENLLNL
ncbi:MAG: glycosyltransferase family 4 protein [Bacteroidia bacterium]